MRSFKFPDMKLLFMSLLEIGLSFQIGLISLVCNPQASAAHNSISLQMADSQGGDLVEGYDEENKIGVFAVANLNDTDGNGTPDNQDLVVPLEVDMCQLKINAPAANRGGTVKLEIPTNVVIWKSIDKTAGKLTAAEMAAIDVNTLPQIYLAEFTKASDTKRDKIFKIYYDGVEDMVKATAIWVTYVKGYNTGIVAPPDLDDAGVKNLVTAAPGLGVNLVSGPGGGSVNGAILHEFKVMPPGMETVNRVKFDVTRQKETLRGGFPPGNLNGEPFPASILPNDDDPNLPDEDVIPKNGHIYSFDRPQQEFVGVMAAGYSLVYRGNFFEYVRVAFGPAGAVFRPTAYITATGNVVDADRAGSVCSTKEPWLARLWAVESVGSLIKKLGNDSTGLPIHNFIKTSSHLPLLTP
jgi:hypothetical protein